MRTVEVHVPCDCSASTFWDLRADPDWDAYCSECDGQRFAVIHNREFRDSSGDLCVHRTSFLERAWPRSMHILFHRLNIGMTDFQVRYDIMWKKKLYDKNNPCVVDITIPVVKNRFSCRGRLWVTNINHDSCLLSSSYELNVSMPFAGRIEKSLEESIVAAYEDIPHRVARYLLQRGPRSPSTTHCVVARRVAERSPGSISVIPTLILQNKTHNDELVTSKLTS